jgi:hypothetical protein
VRWTVDGVCPRTPVVFGVPPSRRARSPHNGALATFYCYGIILTLAQRPGKGFKRWATDPYRSPLSPPTPSRRVVRPSKRWVFRRPRSDEGVEVPAASQGSDSATCCSHPSILAHRGTGSAASCRTAPFPEPPEGRMASIILVVAVTFVVTVGFSGAQDPSAPREVPLTFPR